jgi:hypothetical protein
LEGQTEPTRPDYLAALKGARIVTRVLRVGTDSTSQVPPTEKARWRMPGLIKKFEGTHRYVLTHKGSTTITALPAARQANMSALTAIAA